MAYVDRSLNRNQEKANNQLGGRRYSLHAWREEDNVMSVRIGQGVRDLGANIREPFGTFAYPWPFVCGLSFKRLLGFAVFG